MNREFYKEVLESLTDGVYFVDGNRIITFWNKAAERISGYTAEEVVGKSCADNVLRHVDDDGNHLCVQGCPLQSVMQDGKIRETNVYMHHKFGHRVPVFVRASPMFDDLGQIVGAVEVFADNSQSMNMLQEMEALRKEVLTDQLTNVGNRRYADVMLDRLEVSMKEHGVSFSVLFVDIDHFKHVNDTWGHHVGDQVLTMTAQTLSAALRPLDTICRWGGEEFVIMIPNVDDKGLCVIAERIRMLLQESWIEHGEELIRVTASFGGAVSTPEESAIAVVDRADKQVYLSKESGRNCVHIGGEKVSSGPSC